MPSPPRSARAGSRCDAVLVVARQVLVDHGLERFVMRDIATRTGMRLGNLQYYYPTREDLLEDVIRCEFDRDLLTIRTVIQQAAEPATERGTSSLTALASGLLDNWCSGGASVFVTMSVLAFHHQRFAELSRTIYATFYSELATMIRSIDPSLDDEEAAGRARLVTSVLDGVATQIHAGLGVRAAAKCDSTECADLLARATALIEGIAAGTSASGHG